MISIGLSLTDNREYKIVLKTGEQLVNGDSLEIKRRNSGLCLLGLLSENTPCTAHVPSGTCHSQVKF